MRVLLDHNLPHKLRDSLVAISSHEVITAGYMGWGGLMNGKLLRAAEEAAFDVFVTGDRTLVHEQNLAGRRLAIVALSANNWPIIREHVHRILSAIDGATPGSSGVVECGTFMRRPPLLG